MLLEINIKGMVYMRDEKGRFLKNSIEYEINDKGCHICTSHKKHHTGYIQIKVGNKLKLLHRVMYEEKYGTIPKGLCACHICDTRNCINPDHIFLGTQADNVKDMINKGRKINSIGKNQYGFKLFKAIRMLDNYEEISFNQSEFARKYGLDQPNIQHCLKGRYKQHKGWKFSYI